MKEQNLKACTKCQRTMRRNAFPKDSRRRDGLYPHCRECTAAYRRARALRHDMGSCEVAGCQRPRRYRKTGYCIMHYKRWKKTGTPGSSKSKADQRDTTCSYCGAPGKIIHDTSYPGGGLCEMHHGRWRRHKDLGPIKRKTQVRPPDGLCSHHLPDGTKCDRPYLAGGFCTLHYTRVSNGRHPDDAGKSIRVPEHDAISEMEAAGASPVEPYRRSDWKWKCQCLRCGREIHSTLAAVRQGHDPCWRCSGSRVDPAEAQAYMLSKGLQVLDPWPGRVDRKWRGLHVGTEDKPGCMGEVSPTYHSVKTHDQGVCFSCGERGYSTSKPGGFYIVTNGRIVKCGIANMRNFRSRVRMHATKQGLEWIWLMGHRDGWVAWNLERRWKQFRALHVNDQVTKRDLEDGYTEAMWCKPTVDSFLQLLVSECGEGVRLQETQPRPDEADLIGTDGEKS